MSDSTHENRIQDLSSLADNIITFLDTRGGAAKMETVEKAVSADSAMFKYAIKFLAEFKFIELNHHDQTIKLNELLASTIGP